MVSRRGRYSTNNNILPWVGDRLVNEDSIEQRISHNNNCLHGATLKVKVPCEDWNVGQVDMSLQPYVNSKMLLRRLSGLG